MVLELRMVSRIANAFRPGVQIGHLEKDTVYIKHVLASPVPFGREAFQSGLRGVLEDHHGRAVTNAFRRDGLRYQWGRP